MIVEDVRQRPAVDERQARQIAAGHFGLEVLAATDWASERDRNFQLQCADGSEYVLKIAHPAAARELLECQNALLDHLQEHADAAFTPRVIRATSGEALTAVTSDDGATADGPWLVRLLECLPGEVLARVSPHSPELLQQLGARLAEVDRALLNFEHPAARRDFVWDLRCGQQAIAENITFIADPAQRELLDHFAARFAELKLTERLARLRQSVIHGDVNDHNVLVTFQPEAAETGVSDEHAHERDPHGLAISGLLDFGDVVHTALVADVAVAAAYAMLDKDDPLAAACSVLTGYHAVLPLEDAELAVLFDLICLRLCVSVCMSARQSSQVAENAYLLVSQQPAWQALARLREIHPRWAEAKFRDACDLPACANAARISAWLATHRDTFAHVLPEGLMTGERITFDLSVASGDFESFAEMADPPRLDAALFAQMRRANAPLGIGRYDEPRTVYASEVFAPRDNPHGQWRTIHFGVDLFAPAGTPVLAPLAGVIHGLQDNANPLDYGPTIILRHEVPAETDDPAGEPLTFWTLYGHLSRESLAGKQVGQRIAAGEQLARFGELAINGGWPPHLHFQLIVDPFDATGDFPGVGRVSDRRVWHGVSPNPAALLRLSDEEVAYRETPTEELRAARSEQLGRNLSLSYRQPLRIARGHRQFLLSNVGRRYLDCVNNVAHVGHCHPHVVDALRRQSGVLNTNTRYLHENIVEYARRLTAKFPPPLSVCFFVNSGSEANDLALRLAQAATGAKHVIAVDGAYHGNLSSLIEISSYKFAGPGGQGPGPFTRTVAAPDVYRGPHSGANAGRAYADDIARAVTELQASGTPPAAFICESILSCGGQIVLPQGYLPEAYAAVRAAGGVCIADEVQVGFGRVGDACWGFELQSVIPDIVTLGKPIGNGHPLAAVVTTPEIAAAFAGGMEYFNTFGGNPVSCAVGLAVLDVIETEELQQNALDVGNLLLGQLRELAARHELIGDVRGHGLFLGIEFVTDRTTKTPAARQASYLVERMKDHGILLSTDGPLHNVIKIKPPLCFTAADATRLSETLDGVLGETPARA